MPRTEVIRPIPNFHVDLSDLVEMESSGKFQDEKLDQPVMKENGTTSEKPKDVDILTVLKDGDSRNHFRNFLLH